LERDIPAQQRRQEKNPRQLCCEIRLKEMTILFQINAHKNPFNGVCIQKHALKDAISACNSTAWLTKHGDKKKPWALTISCPRFVKDIYKVLLRKQLKWA